jgi:hypothetical protein
MATKINKRPAAVQRDSDNLDKGIMGSLRSAC